MSTENEDEILKRLNEKLEEDAKEKKINKEVQRRLEEQGEEEEEEESKPREAVFLDKKKRRRKVVPRTTELPECPNCGSTDSEILDTDVIYKRKGELLYHFSEVRQCDDCNRRFGVVKE